MIFSLSIYGVVRMILWILAIYFIVKIISRLLTPFLVKYAAKKMEQKFGQQFNSNDYKQRPKQHKEGETIIDKIPRKEKSSNNSVGEYVDFEEIE